MPPHSPYHSLPADILPAASAQIVPLYGTPASAEPADTLRVAIVGTYAPRRCGIATFTADIVAQLGRYHPEIRPEIYTIDDPGLALSYDRSCRLITADDADSYVLAARRINESGVDAVWIQHEFGIFGGPDGELVCDFADRIAAPLVVTFHTVLTAPTDRQRAIMRHLIRRASRIMVMSRHGRDLLVREYDAPAGAIDIIPHGAPDRPFGRKSAIEQRLGLSGRKVLMTFGLLGPGKGLERVIEAMPAIVARHPQAVYRIVGATHPNLLARDGEAYREKLQALARDLGVEDHVLWDNRFLDTEELLDQIEACDIYVTPYANLQQSTSGTLSYAVALGKAVVSTPYVHARELLADGVGVLIEPHSHAALAEAIVALLDDPAGLAAIERRAYEKGRTTIWPEFAAAGVRLLRGAVGPRRRDLPLTAMPGLSGVLAMSDGTGILQHSIGIVPDRNHGYCLDDNARALMLMNVAEGLPIALRLAQSATYASFVQHAWNPARGRFRNFMRFDRGWAEEVGSEDSNGRALWALGHTVELAPEHDLRAWALGWFRTAAVPLADMTAARALAFSMLGAAAVLRSRAGCNESRSRAEAILDRGGKVLHRLVESCRRPDWAWFEAVLGYDNPRLSQALIEAGQLRGRDGWTAAGIETLAWIADRQVAAGGHFRSIGSETFGRAYTQLPFDQQPLEAQAAVEAAGAAWQATREQRWVEHAVAAYRWYFGANDRAVVLADLVDGRCRDGITPRGRNENCGAESTLAFQLAYYSLRRLCRAASPGSSSGEPVERPSREYGQSASNL